MPSDLAAPISLVHEKAYCWIIFDNDGQGRVKFARGQAPGAFHAVVGVAHARGADLLVREAAAGGAARSLGGGEAW